jgi:hypothetical protein
MSDFNISARTVHRASGKWQAVVRFPAEHGGEETWEGVRRDTEREAMIDADGAVNALIRGLGDKVKSVEVFSSEVAKP